MTGPYDGYGAPKLNTVSGKKMRKCLQCQSDFESDGPSHRICRDCKGKGKSNSRKSATKVMGGRGGKSETG